MKTNRLLKTLTILSSLSLLVGCGQSSGDPKTVNPPLPVIEEVDATRLYLTQYLPSSNIFIGSTRTLSPVVFPFNAKKNIKFISEDESIISVNENGIYLFIDPNMVTYHLAGYLLHHSEISGLSFNRIIKIKRKAKPSKAMLFQKIDTFFLKKSSLFLGVTNISVLSNLIR